VILEETSTGDQLDDVSDEVTNGTTCRYCNKKFYKKSNLVRHQTNGCKGKIKFYQKQKDEQENKHEEQLKSILKYVKKLEEKIAVIEQMNNANDESI